LSATSSFTQSESVMVGHSLNPALNIIIIIIIIIIITQQL
jgi:hypothetical protein